MAKKNKLQKFLSSKYLYRRLVIILIMIILLIFIFSLIKNTINSNQEIDGQLIESTEMSSNDSALIETTHPITNEQNSIDETQSGEADAGTTETTVEVGSAELTSSESTSSESTSSESTRQQEASMDFSKIPYYIEKNEQRYNAYLNSHLSKTAEEIVLAVNMNHDFDFYTNIIPVTEPSVLNVICNKYYQLSSNFTPENLVNVTNGYFVNDGKEYKLSQNALDAFIKMSDEAKKEALTIKIISAYRTYAYQERLYNKYKANNGQAAADRFSARPGHSEHETGLAIDINDVSQSFENTREFVWLQDHAHQYGFILRYPEGKESTTGYMYEPWHYRYLGVELATKVYESGLTYDEYYAKFLLK